MTKSKQRLLFWSGVALSIVGFVFFWRALGDFAHLKNYQRLATLLPFLYGCVLMHVDTLADWSNASSMAKMRTKGAVFAAVGITIGALLWLMLAPNEQAA